MLDPNQWFSEVAADDGSAFSLKIREKLHEEQTPFQLIEIYATEGFGGTGSVQFGKKNQEIR